MSLIIRKAQFNFYDCWNSDDIGWENHTRVQVKRKSFDDKTQQPKVYYVSGKHLPHIKYVQIAKSL